MNTSTVMISTPDGNHRFRSMVSLARFVYARPDQSITVVEGDSKAKKEAASIIKNIHLTRGSWEEMVKQAISIG